MSYGLAVYSIKVGDDWQTVQAYKVEINLNGDIVFTDAYDKIRRAFAKGTWSELVNQG